MAFGLILVVFAGREAAGWLVHCSILFANLFAFEFRFA